MKRIISIILAVVLCVSVLPLAAFAEETALYKSTVDVISTESGYDTCEIYFYDNDCYMYIDDIARYTRSNCVVAGDILKFNHGTREVNIDLTSNTLTEDGITSEMKTLRNGDTIIVHAYPMLTYMGASCSIDEGKLLINMPECTLWEGITITGNEDDVTVEIFGDEAEQKTRLILNGILSILQSDLAHASGYINRREAALLTTQIDLSRYVSSWNRKSAAEQKQIDLFSKAVELGAFQKLEDGFELSDTVYGITLDAVENTLDNPQLFKEFKDCWESDMKIISTGFVLLKNLSSNKKSAEDATAIFNTCSKYISSESPFYRTVTGLKDELYNDTSKNVGAIFYTGLETFLNEGFDKMLELGAEELSLSLSAGVLITDLLDGEEDVFAYATAETNTINLLYLKEEVIDALESLADKILANNYSNQQDIEDYRLLMSLYYRILIATNDQVEEMIVAQDRKGEPEMAALISKLRTNSTGFAQNLYILTTATGKAFPNIESISKSNRWDEDNSIKANAEAVTNGIEGLGASFLKVVLTGIEADSIQYYNCSESCNFAVIEKNGKYGLIDYSGNIILPIEYESIELRETSPSGQETKLYAYDSDYQGYWIEQDGSLTSEFLGGWGFEGGAEVYWCNEPVMFDSFEGKVTYSYEAYSSYHHGSNILGTITKGTADVIPVQEINGYSETTSNGWTTYTVKKVSEKYALLNLKTKTLITDFIFDDYGYSGFVEGILAVSKGDKWGYINEKGQMITDFIYDTSEITPWGNKHMYSSLNNHIIVRQGDSWGLIDTQGSIVVEATYDGISQVDSNGMFWLKENGSWSLYKLDK